MWPKFSEMGLSWPLTSLVLTVHKSLGSPVSSPHASAGPLYPSIRNPVQASTVWQAPKRGPMEQGTMQSISSGTNSHQSGLPPSHSFWPHTAITFLTPAWPIPMPPKEPHPRPKSLTPSPKKVVLLSPSPSKPANSYPLRHLKESPRELTFLAGSVYRGEDDVLNV